MWRKDEGKGALGSCRRRWEDGIKMVSRIGKGHVLHLSGLGWGKLLGYMTEIMNVLIHKMQ